MLKFAHESKETIPEGQEQFYREQEGGSWQLAVEGAVPKAKLDEFRKTNTELQKEREVLQQEKLEFAEKYKDVDPQRYNEMLAAQAKAEEDKMLAEGRLNELMERQRAEYQTKIATVTEQNTTLVKQNHKERISNLVGQLVPEVGIVPTGNLRFIQADANQHLYVDDHGDIRVRGENGPATDKEGNPLEAKEWLKSYAVNEGAGLFASSHGSNAPGNNRPVTTQGRFIHQSQLKSDLSTDQFDKLASGELTVTS